MRCVLFGKEIFPTATKLPKKITIREERGTKRYAAFFVLFFFCKQRYLAIFPNVLESFTITALLRGTLTVKNKIKSGVLHTPNMWKI